MEEERVYHLALDLLARRAWSEAALAAKLLARGGDPHAVERVVDRCRELGYLDDRKLAEERILKHRDRGSDVIHRELIQCGVDPILADELMRQMGEDPLHAARQALIQRFGHDQPVDERDWRRRAGFLSRRGFDWDVIQALLPENADWHGEE